MDTFLKELRFAARMLKKRIGLTVAAVLCLALGIAGTTVVFGLVDTVLLKPLPFKEPDRLAMIWAQFLRQGIERSQSSGLELDDYRESNDAFEEVVGFMPWYFNLTEGDAPERLVGARVSTGLFRMLGVEGFKGRIFQDDDEDAAVVILSYRIWQRRYGGDPSIVGQSISLEGAPYVVVGVLPQSFRLLLSNADLWVPYKPNPHWPRHIRLVRVLGRLKDGVSREQAQSALDAVASRMQQQHPDAYAADSGWGLRLVPLSEQVAGDSRALLLPLFAAVGLVLVIACGSVANLLLARATTRADEMAVRKALGAGTWVLVRQLLTESVLLSVLGGVLGLALALAGLRAVVVLDLGDLPRLEELTFDVRIFAFAAAVSIAAGVVCGLAPALQARKASLQALLKEGGRSAPSGLAHHPVRSALVVVQIALALVVLAGTGLMLRTLSFLERVELGFKPEGVVTCGMFLSGPSYAEPQQIGSFYVRLLEGLEGIPEIRTPGVISYLPLSGLDQRSQFFAEGEVRPENAPDVQVGVRSISPGFFDAMGIPLRQGRTFNTRDRHDAPRVVIVDELTARRLWGERDPIGRLARFEDDPTPRTVVGVVGHIRHQDLAVDSDEQVYIPFPQFPHSVVNLALKSDAEPAEVAARVREVVGRINPQLPIARVQPMTAYVDANLEPTRVRTAIFGLFAAVALVLSTLGIFGVMAYSVSQRRRELGIRLALGAPRRSVVALVLRQGAVLTAAGVVLGLVLAAVLARSYAQLFAELLAGVDVVDLPTFALVSLGLAAVALAASFLPAHRASRVDPATILHQE